MKLMMTCLLLLIAGSTFAQSDTAAIKALLEKDAATWRSGDGVAHAACWQVQPYSRIFVSLADGTSIDVPPVMMTKTDAAGMGNGGSAEQSNFTFSINGNTAWVSHNEISTSKEGKKSYSYEIRLLEKIKGDWKLVGQSIHLYNPK